MTSRLRPLAEWPGLVNERSWRGTRTTGDHESWLSDGIALMHTDAFANDRAHEIMRRLRSYEDPWGVYVATMDDADIAADALAHAGAYDVDVLGWRVHTDCDGSAPVLYVSLADRPFDLARFDVTRWALISRLVRHDRITQSGEAQGPATWWYDGSVVAMLAAMLVPDGLSASEARAIRA